MYPKMDRWLDDYETALSDERYSYQNIIMRSKNRGYSISKKGIYNILNLKEKKHLVESKNETMSTKPHPKTVRTPGNYEESKVSDLKRKSADSKIHCFETRNVFWYCK